MDVTAKAVVLRAIDYKENDKLVLLYSPEYGKISVHARGVRKSTAKLKFACDQFCFGQYELAQTGDRFTLKTCEQLESFFALREDIVVFYAACAAAECIMENTAEGQSDSGVFVAFLRTLQQLCCGVEPLLAALKFLLDFLKLGGVLPNFSRCEICGEKVSRPYWDFALGGVTCDKCRADTATSVFVDAGVASVCALLVDMPYEKLSNITVPTSVLKDALNIFQKYFSFGSHPLKSLTELLRTD